MHCPLILSFICNYMWDLTSKTHIWCVSDFVLKIGYYSSIGCFQIYFEAYGTFDAIRAPILHQD